MKYTLVGQDGNAFALMGYTSKALKREGLGDKVKGMMDEATSGDYNNLIRVCMKYLDMANEKAGEEDDEE